MYWLLRRSSVRRMETILKNIFHSTLSREMVLNCSTLVKLSSFGTHTSYATMTLRVHSSTVPKYNFTESLVCSTASIFLNTVVNGE